MIIRYSPRFVEKLKTLDVRIRKSWKQRIQRFEKNPFDSSLNNKLLCEEWAGFRAIRVGDIKNDYRAIYEELHEGEDCIARFVVIGTHKELFPK